ncbi:type II secretion system F family protein [Limnobacter humi]|uniref:Type II secretion system F family protein n=1 Tax=Limnobacter humi TaxID=1778671 RepID=A0ABT1WHR9_9BURK|nr:type II secretion system F family protein [Limnobacter humi]MCQ8897056.1 type II secretion system F family protein [Limnobacter humi]
MSAQPKTPSASKDLVFMWTEKNPGAKPGKRRSGEVRAKSEQHALFQLSKQGIHHVQLSRPKTQRPGRISPVVVSGFVRQLAIMIQSAVPLAQALSLIAGGMTTRAKRNMLEVVRNIRTDVESGQRLSDAMRKHPRCFDALFCNTLAAGEHAGELDTTLERLASHMEKSLRIRQKLRKAMVYPGIVIVVAVLVSVGMLMFVLPTFKTVYAQFNAELPALTKGLLGASDLLIDHGLLVLGAFVIAVIALLKGYRRSQTFRDACDKLLLKLPVFGELIRTAVHARWMRTFSTLSASGVPIMAALESVAQVARIRVYEEATMMIRHGVATGARVSEGMEDAAIFPPDTVQMIRIGEESGRLDQMLERLANQFEVKLDDQVDTLSTIMEPMIMCVIGGLVGVLIVGMYLPIFKIGGVV